jgi:hypothetical protein
VTGVGVTGVTGVWTVTCFLASAGATATPVGVPHLVQKRSSPFSGSWQVPQEPGRRADTVAIVAGDGVAGAAFNGVATRRASTSGFVEAGATVLETVVCVAASRSAWHR